MLHDLQSAMMREITGTDNLAAPGVIQTKKGINADDRLSIHRNHFRLSLKQALQDNFPVCAELVGEDFFNACMDVYVPAHPPSDPRLHLYGASLPDFFDSFPPVQQHVAWLGDVARVERAVAAVWHGDRLPGLDPADLGNVAEDEIGNLVFCRQASTALVHTQTAAISVWQMHRQPADQQQQIDVTAGPEHGLAWRIGQEVFVSHLPAAEWHFLAALQDGQSLGQAVEQATSLDADFSFAAALQGAFQRGDFYKTFLPDRTGN